MKIVVFVQILFACSAAFAGQINHDCKPNGLANHAKEMMDSKKFWANAMTYIDAEEQNARREFRTSQVVRENDRIRDGLTASSLSGLSSADDPISRFGTNSRVAG